MTQNSINHFFKKYGAPYLFISPFYILFAVFMVYPVINSLYLSFHQWNGSTERIYVGWENYINLIHDGVFIQSLINCVIIFFEYVPIMTFFAVVLAYILNMGKLKLQSFFRTSIFIPYITPVIAVGFVFSLLLDRDYGLVNLLLGYLGIKPVEWLLTPTLARIAISVLVTWRWLGYNMIIMLAGLQSIPLELYDAAKVDGASGTQSFFRITLPLMRPIILFATVLSTIGTFSLFTEPLILTQGGGPMYSTLTPVLYLYSNAFQYLKFGYSSSIAYVYFIILFILTRFEWRYFGSQAV